MYCKWYKKAIVTKSVEKNGDVKGSFLLKYNTYNKLGIGLAQKGVYYEQEKKKYFD